LASDGAALGKELFLTQSRHWQAFDLDQIHDQGAQTILNDAPAF
jgi:hypothetical protein